MAAVVEAMPPRRAPPVVENEVLGMMIFIFTEVMFFAGFVSGYSILKGRAVAGIWPPVTDPNLPATATAISSVALVLSGVLVWYAGRRLAENKAFSLRLLWGAAALAALFVGWQVVEAVQLVSAGLTMVSSAHGGFFYTIVGAHALHAIVALGILVYAIRRLSMNTLSLAVFRAIQLFWYFVVGLWPFLYSVVYL